MKLSQYNTDCTYVADIVSSERITDESTAEVRHIVLRVTDPAFQFIEGQSIAVLVPGPHAFGNKYHIRLYSIASSRMGEGAGGAELSICVRRCFYIDEVSGERYPGVEDMTSDLWTMKRPSLESHFTKTPGVEYW